MCVDDPIQNFKQKCLLLNKLGLKHIVSTGVICFKQNEDKPEDIQYLMVQRIHSLNFSEFLLGKFDIMDVEYMSYMFRNMTVYERNLISKSPTFKKLCSHFHTGRYFANFDNYELMYPVFIQILGRTQSELEEPEWGFPKGRLSKKNKEDPYLCALREFQEETGVDHLLMRSFFHRPRIEKFIGSNKTSYEHVYYVMKFDPLIECNSKAFDKREISRVQWKSRDEVLKSIRCINKERIKMFIDLDSQIINQI
jgi:8-oxo-dGTP pyrophosphatase MutT (NUDIX family)